MNLRQIRFSLLVLVLVCSVPFSGGCSVVLAASGSKDPDMTKIKSGMSRAVVENELGNASEVKNTSFGTTESYLYKVGDEASPGRAIMHGVLDVFTFCLWEYVGFPMEIAQGQAKEIEVDYNSAQEVIDVRVK